MRLGDKNLIRSSSKKKKHTIIEVSFLEALAIKGTEFAQKPKSKKSLHEIGKS